MKKILLLCIFVLSNPLIASSYDDNLKELFELTGMKNNYIQMNNIIIQQMQNGFFQSIDQNISADSYTVEQRKEIGDILKNRFSEMVKDYEAFVADSLPYEKVEREVYIPLYKETYTENEVSELLEFYKSPVGQKTIEVGQKISQQSAEKSAEKYDEMIVSYVKKEIDENVDAVMKEINKKDIN